MQKNNDYLSLFTKFVAFKTTEKQIARKLLHFLFVCGKMVVYKISVNIKCEKENTMKKYESPEIFIIMFAAEDVITASNDANDDSQWTDFY
jgi:hypothetical protein